MRMKTTTANHKIPDFLKVTETELKKRLDSPYQQQFHMQNNKDDGLTNFIYETPGWDALLEKISKLTPELQTYAVNRWYNFWSAQAVEAIFLSHPRVSKRTSETHATIDFYIDEIPFDHKTTVFPKAYPETLAYARSHPGHLIRWLYEKQSQERRHHLKNRLFLILYAHDGQHWKLRAEISLLQKRIHRHLDSFRKEHCYPLDFHEAVALADYIWVIQ
jgi:hypothetical protein